MKKFADKIFGSPDYLWGLLFASKYGAAVQFLAALFFAGFSRAGGPLGCLEVSAALQESALVTLTLAIIFEVVAYFMRRMGVKF